MGEEELEENDELEKEEVTSPTRKVSSSLSSRQEKEQEQI
jgi:hypothetical protein